MKTAPLYLSCVLLVLLSPLYYLNGAIGSNLFFCSNWKYAWWLESTKKQVLIQGVTVKLLLLFLTSFCRNVINTKKFFKPTFDLIKLLFVSYRNVNFSSHCVDNWDDLKYSKDFLYSLESFERNWYDLSDIFENEKIFNIIFGWKSLYGECSLKAC